MSAPDPCSVKVPLEWSEPPAKETLPMSRLIQGDGRVEDDESAALDSSGVVVCAARPIVVSSNVAKVKIMIV